MINQLKALSLAAVATVAAVSTSPAATTNILQSVTIKFTVYSQGPVTTNKSGGVSSIVTNSMNTKEFLATLGTNVTGAALPSGAVLAIATPVGSTNHPIVIVDGTNLLSFPTNFIPSFEETAYPVWDGTVSTNGTSYPTTEILPAIQAIDIPGALNLNLSGIAAVKAGGFATGKGTNEIVTGIYDADLTISGSGTLGTNSVIVTGTISESYWKTLVVK